MGLPSGPIFHFLVQDHALALPPTPVIFVAALFRKPSTKLLSFAPPEVDTVWPFWVVAPVEVMTLSILSYPPFEEVVVVVVVVGALNPLLGSSQGFGSENAGQLRTTIKARTIHCFFISPPSFITGKSLSKYYYYNNP